MFEVRESNFAFKLSAKNFDGSFGAFAFVVFVAEPFLCLSHGRIKALWEHALKLTMKNQSIRACVEQQLVGGTVSRRVE